MWQVEKGSNPICPNAIAHTAAVRKIFSLTQKLINVLHIFWKVIEMYAILVAYWDPIEPDTYLNFSSSFIEFEPHLQHYHPICHCHSLRILYRTLFDMIFVTFI